MIKISHGKYFIANLREQNWFSRIDSTVFGFYFKYLGIETDKKLIINLRNKYLTYLIGKAFKSMLGK